MLQSCFLCCRINWWWISSANGPKETHLKINSFTCFLLRYNCEYSHCEGSKFTGKASHWEKQSLCLLPSQTHARPNIALYNTCSNSWWDELMQNTDPWRECIKYCTQHNIHQSLGRDQWSAAVHIFTKYFFVFFLIFILNYIFFKSGYYEAKLISYSKQLYTFNR